MDTIDIDHPTTRSVRLGTWAWRLSALLAAYVTLGGLISFVGWAADIRRLTVWGNGEISIQPNTCLAAMLAGIAVAMRTLGRYRPAALAGLAFGAIGLVTIFQHLTGIDLGIDTLLMFDRTWGRAATLAPGRMGLPAASSLTLLCAAVLLSMRGARSRGVASGMALVVAGITTLSIVGYLFGADRLYSLPSYTAIALQTSTFLLAASIGLILTLRDQLPVRVLLEDSGAGVLARRSLPFIILAPLMIGWLRLKGQEAGLYDLGMGMAIVVLAFIVLNCVVLARGIKAVSAHERAVRQERDQRDATRRESARIERMLADIGQMTTVWQAETDPEATGLIEAIAARTAAELDVSRSGWAQVDVANGHIVVIADHHGDFKSLRGTYSIQEAAPHVLDDAKAGHPSVVSDLASDPRTRDQYDTQYVPRAVRAHIYAPLHRDDNWVASFWVCHHESRAWTPWEVDLVQLIGERLWMMVQRSRAIAALRASEEALRRADERKDVFLATLAHELRNPLSPIVTSLELLKLGRDDAALVASVVGTMERQVKHMVRLIDDLMDVSRITRDKLQLRMQDIDLRHVVVHAIESCQPMLDEAGHRIVRQFGDQPIYLAGDPIRLTQVVGNLLVNACKYTDSGGTITVGVGMCEGRAEITVADDGIGIPHERLATIFEMFSQIEQSIGRSRSGMGIGLCLVKRLVELHGGSVLAASDGPGRGSRFTVRLPVPSESPKGIAEPLARPPGSLTGQRILVVDDNEDAAHTLGVLLRLAHHEIHVAHDGRTALAEAEAGRPDVILLDLGLPIMDGYEVCRAIRSRPWGRWTVIVAISGWGQDADRLRSAEAGFDGHLVKPVDFDSLSALVASLAGGRTNGAEREEPVQ